MCQQRINCLPRPRRGAGSAPELNVSPETSIDEGQSTFDPSASVTHTSGTRFSMTSISSSR